MKTIWRTIGGLILGGALLLPAAQAATGYGDSPVFAVDLRGLNGGLTVNGRVLDKVSRQGIVGANVSLAGQNGTTLSGGAYTFANVSLVSGNTLAVSASAYLTATLPVSPPPGSSLACLPDVLLQTVPAANQPVVTAVNTTYQPVFISGLPITDDFNASVNWNGSTPSTVEFYANGQLIKSLTGSGPTYTVSLDSSHFNPSLAVGGNTLAVVARNSQGTASQPYSVPVFDVPYPQPLAVVLSASAFLPGSIPATISVDADWPTPPISTPKLNLPVIGTFGLDFKVNPHFQYDLRSSEWELGIGNVSEQQHSGVDTNRNLKLYLGPSTFEGTVRLGGRGKVSPVSGFTDTQVYVGLSLSDKFQLGEPFGLLDLVGPGISGIASHIPVIGDLVKTVSIQCYAEPEIGGDVILGFPGFQFQSAEFGGSIALTAEYEPKLGSAGKLRAYVGGKPSITLQVPEQPPGGLLKQAKFEAYAGVEWEVWIFTFSGEYVFLDLTYPSESPKLAALPQAAGRWMLVRNSKPELPQIVARPNLWGGNEGFVAYSAPARTKSLQAASMSGVEAFRAMGRSSTKGSIGFKASAAQPLDAGAGSGSFAQVDLTLVTNTFPGSDPAMDARGRELMLLYVTDNGITNNLNFTDIKWTRWDGTNWSVPLAIQTNTQAEFAPQVKYDGNGDAIAVWERVNDPNFNQTNLTAMAADMEIIWSRWSRTDGTWSAPVALTTNNYLDDAPLLCGPMADESLLLTWTKNESNLLIGTNGAGSQVLWAQWSPASRSWSAPYTLIANSPYRLSQSLAGVSNVAVYAWSLDTGGTLTNLPDQQVFYCLWTNGGWGSATQFTANALGNRNARAAVSPAGSVYLIWQQASDLVMSANFSASPTLVRANSRTAGFADFAMTFGPAGNLCLLWQEMTTNGCHAHYAVYDPASATWSQDALLRTDPPMERSFAPVWDDVGNLTVAYNLVDIYSTNMTVMLTNGTMITITNVPRSGQVDLVVTKRALIKDLGLMAGDFAVQGNNYLPGDAVTLSANVRNLGDVGMSNVVVSFFDGNPDAGGTLITNVALPGWLQGASTNTAMALWVVPDPPTNHTLYAVVNRTNVATEFNPTNNTQSVSIGGTDLAVSPVSYSAQTNGAVRVIAQVQNLGAPMAANSVLAIRRDGQTGTPIATAAVPALDPGRLAQVALDLPPGTQPGGEAIYRLSADDSHVVADVNTNNNTAAFSVYLWIDSDNDGIPDSWMMQYFGHPTGQVSDNSRAQDSAAGDGISNLQKYVSGKNPLIWDNLHFVGCESLSDGQFNLAIFGQAGSNYTLLASTDLVNWTPVLNFTCTNAPMYVVDPGAKYFGWRFYRVAQGTLPVMLKLALNSPVTPATNGLGFNVQAPLGFSYVIQASTDLINWQPFTNFISTNSIMFFRDRDFTNYSRRFYRAVKP